MSKIGRLMNGYVVFGIGFVEGPQFAKTGKLHSKDAMLEIGHGKIKRIYSNYFCPQKIDSLVVLFTASRAPM